MKEDISFIELPDGTEVKVKKCPFCGSRDQSIKIKKWENGTMYCFVKCRYCKASGGSSRSRDIEDTLLNLKEALEKWNRRTQTTTKTKRWEINDGSSRSKERSDG